MNEIEKQPDLEALSTWLGKIGRSESTGWRWRKRQWLETTIIGGKHYLTREQRARFMNRAAAGEFAVVTKNSN